MTEDPALERQWYWDRRTNKAYYPTEIDEEEGVVEFVTAWHHEEVTDAIEAGALSPLEEVQDYRETTTLDLVDSFRLPEVEATATEEDDA
jgi:hypothetical protein